METTRIDFQKMQAAYFLKYGYQFDETALAMLLILQIEQQKLFKEQNSKLNTAIEKIRASQTTLAPDTNQPGWQAFAYGMGKFGLALLLAVSLSATFYIIHINHQDEQETISARLQWYEDFYHANINGKETKSVKAYLTKNPMPK
jgi:hypothetical protein